MTGDTVTRPNRAVDAAGIFLLALLPRVLSLAAIVTPDERRWVERSAGFLGALLSGDVSGTFQTGHPGVTTMWTGSLGLWLRFLWNGAPGSLADYVAATPTRPSAPPDVLAATRLPTAVLTAVAVLLAWWLLRRLFGRVPALFAAGLIALDPFYLAHSRVIHHDALVTTFVMLSLLGCIGYLWAEGGRSWLVGSAAAGALAALSKGSALFLPPFVGLLWLGAAWTAGDLKRPLWPAIRPRLATLVLWLLVFVFVFVALWPAMWVNPIGTFGGMFDKAVEYAQEAHSKGNYFLGQAVEDPGFLFYPLVLAFRTTPLSLIGLAIFVGLLIRDARMGRAQLRTWVSRPEVAMSMALLAFVVLFSAFMTLGSKKFDRYLLPVFPPIDVLAGLAFAAWGIRLRDWRPAALPAIGVALLALQALSSLPQHPYYLSAYNPLAGGPWAAQRALLVGWGEGLEQAAAYLNDKPDAATIRAATFYYRDFKTFFVGQEEKLTDDSEDNLVPWRNSDYVVFYINQVQRQIPAESTVRYFQTMSPEFTFERNGIRYVQVYRTPTSVPSEIIEEEVRATTAP